MVQFMKQPTIIQSLKQYSTKKLLQDMFAGILVAIVALPLSIALAIASGVSPEIGLYTGIVGGVVVSIFSGSRVQIGGITAATVMSVNMVVAEYGLVGLSMTTIMAGVILLIMGICRLGALLKYIPVSITTGFTAGIALGIFTSQIKEFFGLTVETMPINMIEKWVVLLQAYKSVTPLAIIVGCISLCILLVLPRITTKIPPFIGMLVLVTGGVWALRLPVNTIASVYGTLPSTLPVIELPQFSFHMMQELGLQAFALAFLIAIVSLLSCAVTDGMIGEKHDSNTELIAQGLANIGCGLFGAAPIAGAVARSKTSVDYGGKSQMVGMVHCIVLVLFVLFCMPIIGYIPMPALSAMLMYLSYHMINWSEMAYTIKYAPKSEILVLFATIITAVVFNLMIAIIAGFILSNLLFMKRMSDVSSVFSWRYVEEDPSEAVQLDWISLPKYTEVFEMSGPMFFAASEKILHIKPKQDCKYVILRMRSVTAIDVTAMHRLEHIIIQCKKQNIRVILTHLNAQPRQFLQKAGVIMMVGEENICLHLQDALDLIDMDQ